MRNALVAAFLVVLALVGVGRGVAARQQPPTPAPAFSFAEPGISPDGREIAFASGGDIWSVPAAGGDARLLVANDATESRPLYSPDGRYLAFNSTRTGGGDIYLLSLATGAVRRLTADDGLEQLDAWSRDGRWVYFSSTSRDISGMNDLYRVPVDGGTPMPVSADRYVNEFNASPSPDGSRVAFSARGNGSAQWWRLGSSHLDQSEIWTVTLAGPSYTQLTKLDGRTLWPMWSADGRTLFYVSDRGGAQNVWTRPASADGADKPVTSFKDGRVLWPSITSDGKTIAFERDFGIWTVDTGSGRARAVPIARRGASTMPAPERVRQTNQFENLALSPDGRKIAFIAHGDVFAASAKDGGDAARVTATPGIEAQPAWAPDSRRLVYVSRTGDAQHIALYDFATAKETVITSGAGADLSPVFAPDGKHIAYFRDRKELHVVDPVSKDDRVLAKSVFGDTTDLYAPAWSPDGRWIAAFVVGAKGFTNLHLVPIDGGVPRPVSFLANSNADSIAYGRDGSFVMYVTSQRTEPGQLARVDLVPRTPKYREDQFRDLFAPPPAPSRPSDVAEPRTPEPRTSEPKSVTPVLDDIRRRLSFVQVGVDVSRAVISPDGKTVVMVASAAGQQSLYAYSIDELAADRPIARQLTTSAGPKADPQFTPDSKEVYFLDGGRVSVVSVEARTARVLAVTAEHTVDFAEEKGEIFREAWTLMRDNFFDAAFNGVDWTAERARFAPRVEAASSPDELRRILRFMIGDLNASHLGFTGPAAGGPAVGRLGLTFDRIEYERDGRLKITSVLPLGPAAVARDVKAGEYLVAVDGKPTGAGVNLDELLANTIDRRVTLAIAAAPGGPTRDVVVKPTNQATEKNLIYRQWVESNRDYVLAKSGGRLGYVHMFDMSQGALDQLHADLDADNHIRDGVIIDVRNNNGGFVNVYALDVLARQPYLRMSLRGLPDAPARTSLGQRALERPTALVTNQHSLSDAEDFTEGYRALKLGPVIGEPTAGWIIYTWNVRLLDGSTFRLPHERVTAGDSTDMERHPRPVDYPVTRPIGETLTGKDSQLDEAIRVLLLKLGKSE